MTTKHTPGTWFVGETHQDDEGYAEISVMASVDGKTVAPAVVVLQFPNVPGMQEANAHLISAAPDLLEALERCTAWMESLRESTDAGFWDWSEGDEYMTARAAIAKARGSQ